MVHMMSWRIRVTANISLMPCPVSASRALMPNWKLISRSMSMKVMMMRMR